MAVYDISTLGVSDNYVTFNDDSSSPYFRIIKRYPTRRELREYDIAIPENTGAADWQSFIGKEYFIIDGILIPSNDNEFYQGRRLLRKVASLTLEQADTLSDNGYVPYKWTEDIPVQQMVKVMYVDMQESVRQGIVQPFRLLCKTKYPIITAQTPKTATITIGSVNTLGGFGVPFLIPLSIPSTSGGAAGSTFPVTYPVMWGSSKSTGSASITNAGDIAAYPSISIIGPISRPKITNVTTGEYIEFDTNLPTSSDGIAIQYDADSISMTRNGANIYGSLTAGSSLFRLRPGINTFTLTGTSVGTGASAAVTASDAWPIS